MPSKTISHIKRDWQLRQHPDTTASCQDRSCLTGEVSVCPVRYLPKQQAMEVSQQEDANLFGVYVQVKKRFRGTDCFEWRWLYDFATQQSALTYADNLRKRFAAVRFGNGFPCKDTGQSTPNGSKMTRSEPLSNRAKSLPSK